MAEWFFVNLLGLLRYQLIGVALFLPIEVAFPKARIPLSQRASGIIFLLTTALLTALAGLAVFATKEAFQIQPFITLRWAWGGPVVAAIVLALWGDFQFYILHRLEHRFLWRFHAVHHSIRNLSAANSYHHWTESIWLTLSTLPMLFIDVQAGPTLAALAFLFHYQQFYIHSSSKPHFGLVRYALVDNRYHRIHHSVQSAHHDKNFGATTPLWDWLFGTLYMPESHEWPDVGLADLGEPQSLKEWAVAPWRLGDGERPHLAGSPSRGTGEALLDGDRPANPILIP